jgi:hypothetical protein
MRMRGWTAGLAVLAWAGAEAARAGEVWLGLYAHDVDIHVSDSGIEPGPDVQLGWRGDRIQAWRPIGRPSPYVLGSINTQGATSFAAAGLSWKFRLTEQTYFRPGIGLAVNNGPDHFEPDRIDFGSRVTFEPELNLGWRFGRRVAAELSWVHLSHAQLFGEQNPGMDDIGVRLVYSLGAN